MSESRSKEAVVVPGRERVIDLKKAYCRLEPHYSYLLVPLLKALYKQSTTTTNTTTTIPSECVCVCEREKEGMGSHTLRQLLMISSHHTSQRATIAKNSWAKKYREIPSHTYTITTTTASHYSP